MLRFSLILLITIYLSYSANAKFPDDPKPCKYGDSECLTKIIEYFIKEKSDGDSSINLVKINPLQVKEISLKQGAESPVNIDLTFKNSNIYGLPKAKITKVKGFGKDMTEKHELTLTCEQVDLVGDYSVNGRILLLPISGNGKSNITMLNVDITLKFTGAPMEKDGKTYMQINKFHLDIQPKGMIFKIDNLFNGDKILGDNMNYFLNENWAEIYKEIGGTISSAFGKIFKSIIGHVFTKHAYNEYLVE